MSAADTLALRADAAASRPDARRPDAPGDAGEGAPGRGRVRARTVARTVGALAVLGAAASSSWWGPRALGELSFFRVRRVELEGVRFASPASLLARLAVDTTTSVWTELAPLERRVAAHPLVAGVRVARRLPGTLQVTVAERAPVAMAPTRAGIAVYDAAGAALPIDPTVTRGLDVPVVAARDTALLRLLGALRDDMPRLFARVSEARRVRGRATPGGVRTPDEFVFAFAAPTPGGGATLVVRTMPDVTAGRLADLVPVEDDLARRRVRVAELDLRFRDQVIARLP